MGKGSLHAFLGLKSKENELKAFDFLGGAADKLEERMAFFILMMVCHCLGNNVLEASLARFFRDIAPLWYVALIFATFAKY